MKRILVTGGEGRFAKVLKNKKSKFKFIFRNKKQLNILSETSIKNNIKKFKPHYLMHLAGLSRPMKIHDKNIKKSIKLNIIGTANIVRACIEKNLKLIYFSTSYVYPGLKGNYRETDPLLPLNNYAWSKLGGEASVQMYKNSLIIRACMTEKPFIHKKAFSDVKLNFIFHENVVPILIKLLNKKGVVNLGGPTQTVYNFAKKYNKFVKKISFKKLKKINFPKNASMNLNKLHRLIKR